MLRYLRFLPLLLIVSIGSFTTTPSTAQTNNEEPGLRKFVERMLSFSGGDTKVIVGKLPEKMPVELPIPAKSQILGSTVNNKGDIQVVLDVSQPVEEVTDFYKNKLQISGWQRPKLVYNSGFVETRSEFGGYTVFCNKAIKPMSLTLNIKEAEATPTAVSVYLNTIEEEDEYHPCKYSSTTNIIENKVKFPPLTPPLNTEVSKNDRNYDMNNSSVTLETKLDSQTLANHYIQQLEKAGWKKIDSGHSNSFSWSTWTFKDEQEKNWQVQMSFTRIEGKPNQYFANLEALEL